jgi:hypothetical protein
MNIVHLSAQECLIRTSTWELRAAVRNLCAGPGDRGRAETLAQVVAQFLQKSLEKMRGVRWAQSSVVGPNRKRPVEWETHFLASAARREVCYEGCGDEGECEGRRFGN